MEQPLLQAQRDRVSQHLTSNGYGYLCIIYNTWFLNENRRVTHMLYILQKRSLNDPFKSKATLDKIVLISLIRFNEEGDCELLKYYEYVSKIRIFTIFNFNLNGFNIVTK